MSTTTHVCDGCYHQHDSVLIFITFDRNCAVADSVTLPSDGFPLTCVYRPTLHHLHNYPTTTARLRKKNRTRMVEHQVQVLEEGDVKNLEVIRVLEARVQMLQVMSLLPRAVLIIQVA